MTATGLSEKVVADRVAWVRDMVAALRRVPLDRYDVFLSDERNVAAAESYLRRALEALMDLGRHILAKGFGAAAPEYREISRRLLELGVLSPEQAGLMGELAGYRNRMVHFYHRVSGQELYDICAHHVQDLDTLVDAILAWVAAHPDRIDRSL